MHDLNEEQVMDSSALYIDREAAVTEVSARLRHSLHFLREREESAQQVLRSEYKYQLPLGEAHALERKLYACVPADPHNGVGGYLVRSLYFDTLNCRDYQEKLDGVDPRRKLRLRIYDPDDSVAYLEMKQKQGGLQKKRSLRIQREDALRLIRCDYGVLLKYDTAFAEECYALMSMSMYRPKVIVQFLRSAYIYNANNTRVTFDRSLTATQASFDLFSKTLGRCPVMDPYAVILEVKYNGFLLDHVKRLLRTVDRTALAQSKYCLACEGTR